MAKTVEHEGYTIQSATHHPLESKRWQLRIFISFIDYGGDRTRKYSADALYAIEQGADIHGVTFGQRPIAGKVEDQFVMDMRTEDRRAPPCAIPHHVFGCLETGRDGHHAGSVGGRMPHRESGHRGAGYVVGAADLCARYRMAAHD